MKKVSLACVLALGLILGFGDVSIAAAPAKGKAKAEESAETIKQKLDVVGKKLVQDAARTVSPPKSNKAVTKEDKGFVARYVEIDVDSLSTEVRPASGSGGKYVGVIRYLENHFECKGPTKEAALKAQCTMVRSRRMNELIRYDGKWSF